VHVSRWVTTHGYALNVDLDPAPFTDWITACGLEDAAFTTVALEAGRPVTVDDVRPFAVAALEEVFGLELEPLPVEDGAGLWAQPVHAALSARVTGALDAVAAAHDEDRSGARAGARSRAPLGGPRE